MVSFALFRYCRIVPAGYPNSVLSIVALISPSGARAKAHNNYTDDDPPHIQAINHYKQIAKDKSGEFTCLMEFPNKDKPKPLVYRFTNGGPQRKSIGATVAVAIATKASASTPRYGLML